MVTGDDSFESCFEKVHVLVRIDSTCSLQKVVGVGDKRVPTVANNQNRRSSVLSWQIMSLHIPRSRIGRRSLQIKWNLGLAHKELKLTRVFEGLVADIL